MTLNRITFKLKETLNLQFSKTPIERSNNKLKTNKDSYDVIFDITRELKKMLPNYFFKAF